MLLMLAGEEEAGELSNDPADLTWTPGEFSARFWWHQDTADNLSVNTNGTGGMPAVTDPIGALLNGDANNGSVAAPQPRLPQYSGAGIRRADHVEFPTGALYLYSQPLAKMNTKGITVAFSAMLPTVTGAGQYVLVAGRDNPYDGAAITNAAGQVNFRGYTLATGPVDWSDYRRVVIASDVSGNTKMRIDGALVYSGATQVISSNWDRLMNYFAHVLVRQRALFVADHCFDDADSMALLDRFMEYGP